ncbi:MAG: 50S ribosomal protein L25 [Clostridiales bacterium]|jgi:large subunit ribosomal protein L25|nr:50S ribosomal protein L25 [Clostridiales bacterium]
MDTIKAEKRNPNLKAKQLRRTGFVPGCIFGKNLNPSLEIQIKQNEAAQFLKSNSTGSTVQIALGRKKYFTLLKEISHNPLSNQIEHLSFQELVKGEPVSSAARIILLNREKVQDLINQTLFEIPYKTIPSKLVDRIEIDLEGMKAGDSVKVEDLDFAKDEEIELLIPADSMIFNIVEPRKAAVEEETAEEAAGEEMTTSEE